MAQTHSQPDTERGASRWGLAWPARRVALGYAAVAALWIWCSDSALELVTQDPHWLRMAQSYKGWLFVLVTACLLYVERRRSDSARARLEERLRHSAKMEALGQLAGGLAHDFNNFLTTILGHCEFLSTPGQPAAERDESLTAIRSAARSAGGLTRSLLAVARRQVLASEVVDLTTEVQSGLGLLRHSLPPSVRVTYAAAPGGLPVEVDRVQLQQVLLNLVANARDAMPDGGALGVTLSRVELAAASHDSLLQPGTYALLSVSDTGVGMNAVTKARIFEPFYTTKEPGRGTGLGLATTFGIVRQSGGRIFVESAPGAGAQFSVYLPLAPEPQPPITGEERPPTSPVGATVLVVDDEPSVVGLITRILQREGYQVLRAADGEGALTLWREHQDEVALVLTDVVMPRSGGLLLAETVQAERPGTKVLLCSGHAETNAVRRSVTEGGASFLAKPFTPAELATAVREALGT